MFELYGVPYTYQVDQAGIDLHCIPRGSEHRVSLHYLTLIQLLESGTPITTVLDQAATLYWELVRSAKADPHLVYEKKQLEDVTVSLHPDIFKNHKQLSSNLYDALVTADVNVVADGVYQLVVPKEVDGTFLSFDRSTIVIAFGFHGMRISPVINPDLGHTSYFKRRAWAEGFCFQNFTFNPPTPAELHMAALMIKKQICDFTLERSAIHFCPEIVSFLKVDLPGDVE